MPIMHSGDLLILQTELNTDPNTVGYAAMSPGDVADYLNAPIPTGGKLTIPIELRIIGEYLSQAGKLKGIIEDASIAASTLRFMLQSAHIVTLNPDHPGVAQLFVSLRNSGLISQANLDAIQTIAQIDELGPSRTSIIGLGEIYPENVEQARDL